MAKHPRRVIGRPCRQAFLTVFLSAAATLAGVSAASAQDYEDGLRAYQRGQIEKARNMWTAAAAAGDRDALYALGVLFEEGKATESIDLTLAATYYEQAAAQGHPGAMNNLGLMHARGAGVEKDLVRAADLWKLASRAGHAQAQYNLALAHYQGKGVARDEVKAARLFQASAEQGYAIAQYALGEAYRLGVGIEQNRGKALFWYAEAAKQGHERARERETDLRQAGVKELQPTDYRAPDSGGETAAEQNGDDQERAVDGVSGDGEGDAGEEEINEAVAQSELTEAADGEENVQSAAIQADPAPEPATPEETAGVAEAYALWLGSFEYGAEAREFVAKTRDLYPALLSDDKIAYEQVDLPQERAVRVLAGSYREKTAAKTRCQAVRSVIENAFCLVIAR